MIEYILNSPVGKLHLKATKKSLVNIAFIDAGDSTAKPLDDSSSEVIDKTIAQLNEYFEGKRTVFNLPLALKGTHFQMKVWQALQGIPYGMTVTYSELSKKLGDLKAIRAVGKANGQNPLPIIIPCHRVIGSNNDLIGYAGGIERKGWLLKHEGALLL